MREHVRETLQTEPQIMYSTNEMFDCIRSRLEIKSKDWIANSRVLRDLVSQKRMREYLTIK